MSSFYFNGIASQGIEMPTLMSRLCEQQDLAGRVFAISGIARSILDTGVDDRDAVYPQAVQWLADTCLNIYRRSPSLPDLSSDTRNFIEGLKPSNLGFDRLSLISTLKSRPFADARRIEQHSPPERSKLVIGLGHGGIFAATQIFSKLHGENNSLYFVRFSLNHPGMRTSKEEDQYLNSLASEKDIVIVDEEYFGGDTMDEAMKYLSGTLVGKDKPGTKIIGFAPVDVNLGTLGKYRPGLNIR